MAESVRGTLPTAGQRSDARTLFYDGDKCNEDKVAAQVAMHRDAIADVQDMNESMHRCMYGDEATGSIGMQPMIKEMWEAQTGKNATTRKVKNSNWDTAKIVWMIVGGLTLLGFLITAGMITFN